MSMTMARASFAKLRNSNAESLTLHRILQHNYNASQPIVQLSWHDLTNLDMLVTKISYLKQDSPSVY